VFRKRAIRPTVKISSHKLDVLDITTYITVNDKNCSLSTVLTATHQKLQKS